MEFPKFPEERSARFLALIEKSPRRVNIIISHIDPDSIACAVIMKKALESLGKIVCVFSSGAVDRFPQNQMIMSTFHLNYFTPVETLPEKTRPEELVILLDSPTHEDSRLNGLVTRMPNIIIDHHEIPSGDMTEDDDHWFYYDKAGACISMVMLLCISLDLFPGGFPKEIATLAMIAILGDTSGFSSAHATALDFKMAALLSDLHDQKRVSFISSSLFDEEYLNSLGMPKERRKRVGTVLVFQMADLSLKEECFMVRAAEFFARVRGVLTVYVWAVIDNILVVKVRNSDAQVHLDSIIGHHFGKENGGSKDNSTGAAQVKLNFLGQTRKREMLVEICRDMIDQKVFGK